MPRRGLHGPFEGRHQRLKPRPLHGIRDARPALAIGDPTPCRTQGTPALFDSACPKFGMRRRSGTEPHGVFVGQSGTGCTESHEAMRSDATAAWGVHTPGARFRLRCFQPISALCRLASPGRSAQLRIRGMARGFLSYYHALLLSNPIITSLRRSRRFAVEKRTVLIGSSEDRIVEVAGG